MIKYLIIIILAGLVFSTESSLAQRKTKSMRQIERRSSRANGLLNTTKSKKVRQAEKKAEDTKEKQKESYEKAKSADKKHRMDMQSENTRQMMKDTEKNSDDMRKKKREPFFRRLFRKNPY